MEFRLEICVDSIESAVNAEAGGADRIELCSDLAEGGITPSYGMITAVRNEISIEVNVIIRPRGGDFLFSDSEYDIMRRDIEMCGECGVNGIVTGLLLENGEIDTDRTARLVELASPMPVTFHRAFDLCADPYRGLQEVIESGASRLLTSGQENKAVDGAELIGKLVKKAGPRLIIMPGSGLDESNISKVAMITGASEFHLSIKSIKESEMKFRRDVVSMGSITDLTGYSKKIADPDRIRKIISILKMI